MRSRKRIALRLLCMLATLGMLSGCGREAERELDMDDWQSWRIGTPLAWSSDYYLSEQVRVPNLYLYDSIGDSIMALRFGYVDAIAVDALYAYSMVAEYSDLRIQPEPIGEDSLVAYITNGRRDILEQMNGYIPKFKASEAYADLVGRANAEEFVPDTDIPEITDGEVLRVAINTGGSGYPYTYYDFVSGEPQGVDIEFIKHFAAEYGYTIEWFDSSWDACSLAIANGDVDVFVYAISLYYAGEVEAMGTCLHSDPYFNLDLVLVTQNKT
ncbi:transporter substrate-binding domain-containing protein [Clostridium sp. Marseille-P3244]|uniref:transporter substrate-binding domain-containing protein n=1 Tax=Clostridium sp. Marseille-P3244 TaxID=1871020 RepID=UPI0009305CC4|nr:transporter substrate-binding domain-containing protein [Clostridium sp. Marseille-P3244]